jgi:hypothetical protein
MMALLQTKAAWDLALLYLMLFPSLLWLGLMLRRAAFMRSTGSSEDASER